jgi:hypothetical protein
MKQFTKDSAGAFVVGELERLAPELNAPLQLFTWSRDIELRTDLSAGNDSASYLLQNFTTNNSGVSDSGIAWAGKKSNRVGTVGIDASKVVNPLHIWENSLIVTIPELAGSELIGRSIIEQKFTALQTAWQTDVDRVVYLGDSTHISTYTGLLNSAAVTATLAANTGTGSTRTWSTKTQDQIATDCLAIQQLALAQSANAVAPNVLLVPFESLVYLQKPYTLAGGGTTYTSLMEYIIKSALCTFMGETLEIRPVKYLSGGTWGSFLSGSGVSRLVAYNQQYKYVRFPMVSLMQEQPTFDGLSQLYPFWGKLGQLETVYPETIAYMDGI